MIATYRAASAFRIILCVCKPVGLTSRAGLPRTSYTPTPTYRPCGCSVGGPVSGQPVLGGQRARLAVGRLMGCSAEHSHCQVPPHKRTLVASAAASSASDSGNGSRRYSNNTSVQAQPAGAPAPGVSARPQDPDSAPSPGSFHEDLLPGGLALDWKVGAVLAGASFEAYCELKERGLPERHECGADVFYLDRDFVRDKLAGLLRVTVHSAASAPAAAASSPLSPDPQLLLSVGDCTWRSAAMLNNMSPEWEESCTLYIRHVRPGNPAEQALQFWVEDPAAAPSPAADCALGCAAVGLGPLCDGATHELDVQLVCRSGDGGADDGGGGSGRDGSGGHDSSSSSSSGVARQGAGAGVPVGALDGSGSSSGEAEELRERGPCGSVRLTCRFLPFSGEAAQGAAAHSEMGGPVVGTPGQIPLASDWRELLEIAGVAAQATLKPVAYIENAATNTQAWVYCNREQRTACVAFRGTEQGKWRVSRRFFFGAQDDILTDLHLVPAPLDPDRVAAAPRVAGEPAGRLPPLAEVSQPVEEPSALSRILTTVERAKEEVAAERAQQAEDQSSQDQAESHILSTAVDAMVSTAEDVKAVMERVQEEIEAQRVQAEAGEEAQPWVHSGFLSAYDSVRPAVLSVLAAVLDDRPAPREGSQQQRSMQDSEQLGQRQQQQEEQPPWQLYCTGHSLGGALATLCAWDVAHRGWASPVDLAVWNYGCPRVGNRAFAEHYNQLVPNTFRVVNARDTVCTVPRLMGYAHVGHAVYLESDGSVQLVMNSTERLGEGLSLPDVAPAVSAVMAAKVPELLPETATEALKHVGLEVATEGLADSPAAHSTADSSPSSSSAVEDGRAGSGDAGSQGGGGVGADGGAVALSPHDLDAFWQAEREAWGLLLDGGALDQHMEPLYLANLRAFLARQEGQGRLGSIQE